MCYLLSYTKDLYRNPSCNWSESMNDDVEQGNNNPTSCANIKVKVRFKMNEKGKKNPRLILFSKTELFHHYKRITFVE
jgi:hypothetical protein